jgi:hypothetical protein
MDGRSTKSNGRRDANFVAADDLRSRRSPPSGRPKRIPNRNSPAKSVFTDRICRSEIISNRDASKCGMRFAGLLDREDSRLAERLVNEETA